MTVAGLGEIIWREVASSVERRLAVAELLVDVYFDRRTASAILEDLNLAP